MDYWARTIRLGVKSLLVHPLRSLLTVLGILIGVASVIWLLAIGEGISQKAQEQFASLGANNIIVRSVKPPDEDSSTARGPVPYGITRSDYAVLSDSDAVPTVTRTLPIRESQRRFRYGQHEIDGRLVGCTPDYLDVMHLELESGRFLSDAEDMRFENVCVISAGVARQLFPLEDPIGKELAVEAEDYRIVGVVKPRSRLEAVGESLSAQDFSADVYIPINTFWERIGDLIMRASSGSFEGEIVELSQVTLRVDSVDNVLNTARLVRQVLEKRHRRKDIAVVVPLELLEQARMTRLMFMAFMGLIAAVSLLVGGIGIMNIMLATVTERTREIGIRRALGAKRGDITRQFLVETISLSIAGGVCGILIGLTCGPFLRFVRFALEHFLPEVMSEMPAVLRTTEPQIVSWSIPLAFGISVVVGVLFGLYPATRAAAMDPIEALRHQ